MSSLLPFLPPFFQQGASPENKDSLSELKKEMEGMGYVLVKEEEMPFVIRQHARLYELIAAQATVWQGPK